VSVGHVARVFEESGISTVIVAVKAFRASMEVMSLPRVLLTPHPMGRPLGAPGDQERQREVIMAALNLLGEAGGGGTIVELPGRYHPM
jgi:hypothetical protein